MESARVHYGVAQTHHKLTFFNGIVEKTSDNGIKQLIEWKRERKLSNPAAKMPPSDNKTKTKNDPIKQADKEITWNNNNINVNKES